MNSDVGRERGREKKIIGRLALRSRLASPCSEDRVRQTDCLSRAPREGGSASAQAHKGPSGWWRGREAVKLRRPVTQGAGARTVPPRSNREGGAKLASPGARASGWGGPCPAGTRRKGRGQASSPAHHCGRSGRGACGLLLLHGSFCECFSVG